MACPRPTRWPWSSAARSAWWLADTGGRARRPPWRSGCCRRSGIRSGGRSPSSPPGSSWRSRCGCSARFCKGCRTWRSSAAVQLAAWMRGRWSHRRARFAVPVSTRWRPDGSCRSCCRRSSPGAAWRRALPMRLPRRSRGCRGSRRGSVRRGAWISVGQIAQVLLSGTDLVVVGTLLGPEAIVPYACTGKLMTMLANQPQLFMQMALPALSELRGAAARERLFEVSRSMTQLMLLASGGHRRGSAGGQRAVRLLVGGRLAIRRPRADGAARGRHARAPRQRRRRLHAVLLRSRTAARAHKHRRRRRRRGGDVAARAAIRVRWRGGRHAGGDAGREPAGEHRRAGARAGRLGLGVWPLDSTVGAALRRGHRAGGDPGLALRGLLPARPGRGCRGRLCRRDGAGPADGRRSARCCAHVCSPGCRDAATGAPPRR